MIWSQEKRPFPLNVVGYSSHFLVFTLTAEVDIVLPGYGSTKTGKSSVKKKYIGYMTDKEPALEKVKYI